MKTILVVDDDKNLRRLYKSELEAEGFRVRLAENGKDAIKQVAEQVPDLIVMDVRMPEMDGLESMAQVLRAHKRLRVILNTAYSSYQDNFLTWAADGYIVKSADLQPLKNKIREVLGREVAA